jgi:hypothetical protein
MKRLDRLRRDKDAEPDFQTCVWVDACLWNGRAGPHPVRALFEEHHKRIQALLDKKPNASRQELAARIHAISDETHGEIHALLSDRQRKFEQAMRQREHHGAENRRPAPTAASPWYSNSRLQKLLKSGPELPSPFRLKPLIALKKLSLLNRGAQAGSISAETISKQPEITARGAGRRIASIYEAHCDL